VVPAATAPGPDFDGRRPVFRRTGRLHGKPAPTKTATPNRPGTGRRRQARRCYARRRRANRCGRCAQLVQYQENWRRRRQTATLMPGNRKPCGKRRGRRETSRKKRSAAASPDPEPELRTRRARRLRGRGRGRGNLRARIGRPYHGQQVPPDPTRQRERLDACAYSISCAKAKQRQSGRRSPRP